MVPSRECVAYCHEKSDLVLSPTEPDVSIYCVVPIIYCTAFYSVFSLATPPLRRQAEAGVKATRAAEAHSGAGELRESEASITGRQRLAMVQRSWSIWSAHHFAAGS